MAAPLLLRLAPALALVACATETPDAPAAGTGSAAGSGSGSAGSATAGGSSAGAIEAEPVATPDAGAGIAAVVDGLLGDPGVLPSDFAGALAASGGWGSGSGSGLGRRTPTAAPVKLGELTVLGDLDKAILQRYLKRNLSKITFCYERALGYTPALRGVVTAKFYIGGSGTVQASTAKGVRDDVSSCVAVVIKAIQFPKPTGSSVVVTSRFTFAPAP